VGGDHAVRLRPYPCNTAVLPYKIDTICQTYSSDSVLPRRVCVMLCELMVYRFDIIFASTYVVSSPLTTYYYTQLIGDARTPPTLLASSGFQGIAVIGESLSICLCPLSIMNLRC
jgi:Pectate lyase superfamily protein